MCTGPATAGTVWKLNHIVASRIIIPPPSASWMSGPTTGRRTPRGADARVVDFDTIHTEAIQRFSAQVRPTVANAASQKPAARYEPASAVASPLPLVTDR